MAGAFHDVVPFDGMWIVRPIFNVILSFHADVLL
jgi:hypothetical protein